MAANDNKYASGCIEHSEYIDVVLPLCRGCSMLKEHISLLLPVIKCSYAVNVHTLIEGMKNILLGDQQEFSRLPLNFHLIVPFNIDAEELRYFLGVMNLADIRPTQIHLHAGWDVFLSISASEHAISIFKSIARLYVYVDNIKQSKTLLRLVTSKPLSRFRSTVTIVYYATAADLVKEIIDNYVWNGAPYILVIVRIPSSNGTHLEYIVKDMIKQEDFVEASISNFIGLPLKWYTNSQGDKWIGLTFLRSNTGILDGKNVVLVHPLKVHTDLMSSLNRHTANGYNGSSRIAELLCTQALWKIKVEAIINGVPVLDEDMYKILKTLKEVRTLKAACQHVNKSYPTIRNKIFEVEKTLGTSIVKTTKGGAHRGCSEPTIDGEVLVRIYEELVHSIEKELHKRVEDVCRKLLSKNGGPSA